MSETAFGTYLRTKRVAAGLSLRAVADALEITHVYLGEVERGVRGPLNRKHWSKLRQAVAGISRDELQRLEAVSRPLQLNLQDAPPQYQDLGLALARRMEERDISPRDMKRLMKLLRGSDD